MFEPYDPRPAERRVGRLIAMTLGVFALGGGLGFVWKHNLLPVELLPAHTGVLDPQADRTDQDLLMPPIFPQPVAEFPARRSTPATTGQPFLEIPEQPAEPSVDDAFPPESIPKPTIPDRLSESLKEAGRPTRERQPSITPPVDDITIASETAANVAIQQAAFQQPAVSVLPGKENAFPAESHPPQSRALQESPPPNEAPVPKGASEIDLSRLLQEYDEKIELGEALAAHRLLSQIYWKAPEFRDQIIERLDRSASSIFFLPQPHFVEPYVIEPGDRLESIAAQYHVSWEYLSKVNRVDPKRIQAGRRLKVIRGPFSAVVELSDYSLTVHLQGYYVRRFQVGIGKENSSPIGKFEVLNKVVNPQYTDPDGRVIAGDDPANPLGERWIDLGNSYGIHGTIEPDSIGQAASAGCIRLNDRDVVAVFDFLTVGSEVVIRR